MTVAPGTVLWADLGFHLPPGHEQQGGRPVLVVADPRAIGKPRFPLLLVAPLTSDQGQAWVKRSPRLYPRLPAGAAGIPRASVVLLDQMLAMDPHRITGYLGRLTESERAPIQASLRAFMAM